MESPSRLITIVTLLATFVSSGAIASQTARVFARTHPPRAELRVESGRRQR